MGHERQESHEHNDSPLTLIADMPADMDFRCHGPSADAQAFGCHHPNIATKKQETKSVIWMPICIQYATGAVSL
jgi:hypothetical protein